MTSLDWGSGWVPLAGESAFQVELERELATGHPLFSARPVVIGRCLVCDDVVVRLGIAGDAADLAVVHLTWSGQSETRANDGVWPFFEQLTLEDFVARFIQGGEHL
jgi:hypothetical protein